jgi:hypothetical protein
MGFDMDLATHPLALRLLSFFGNLLRHLSQNRPGPVKGEGVTKQVYSEVGRFLVDRLDCLPDSRGLPDWTETRVVGIARYSQMWKVKHGGDARR